MRVLITGATGFIGKHLTSYLLQNKHMVYCTLRNNEVNPFDENIVKSIFVDQCSIKKITSFLIENRIEGIIHLASFVQSGDHDQFDIESLVHSNITFGTIILEASSNAKVRWFINTGTYWQFYNSDVYNPVNLYAATKQAFLDIAKYYWDTNRFKFCTIILYDTYGPNDPRNKILNHWHRVSQTGESLDMSPGDQLIDITHVSDIASAFELLAHHLKNEHPEVVNGDLFALKAKKRYTLKELSIIFEKATGKKLNINWNKRSYRNREIMLPWINGKEIPGWEPKVSLLHGILNL